MVIALIGMSGSGKSYWSMKLAESGFRRFCCDELITEKLASDLRRSDGRALSLGEWMGFPYDPGYETREAIYLASEEEVLCEVLQGLEDENRSGGAEDTVVDTTGSVIYMDKELLLRLRAVGVTVNLTVPPEIRGVMLREYVARPRPILWRGLFSRMLGEKLEQAIARSYNTLLDAREQLYHRLADVEIDYYTRSRPGFSVADFLTIVGKVGQRENTGL